MAINIGVFGAFVVMALVFGFFLWQTLFFSEKHSDREPETKPAYSEQQGSSENSFGTGVAPSAIKSSTDEAIAEYTKWLAIFTLFLVLATIGLFISGERNVDVARRSAEAAVRSANAALKQAGVMQGQLKEIKRQSVAAERASTTGRAYLFVKFERSRHLPRTVTKTDSSVDFVIPMSFSIQNAGQTPAVITRIETHMLVADKVIAKHLQFFSASEPPDPTAENSESLKEKWRSGITGIESGLFVYDETKSSMAVIPSGWMSGVLEQNFSFLRSGDVDPAVANHGAWFYCRITYKDVFGFERHTTSYFGMYGAGVQYPPNSAFNEWD